MSYPTWSDLNSDAIVPPLGARQARDLGPVALMVSPTPDLRCVCSLLGEPRDTHPFFNGSLHREQGPNGIAVAGPYVGSPYAVMLLESLVAKGARQVVVLGWCGAVTPDLCIGDLLVPDKAFVDEGTSRHYRVLDMEPPVSFPHDGLSGQLKAFAEKDGTRVHQGPLWTTDAVYRETAKKVAWFRDRGALAVEMECSALFSAAQFRGVRIAALLVVSDSVASKDWAPGFRAKRFKQAQQTAARMSLGFARSLSHP